MNRIVQVLEGRPVIAAVRHLPDLAPALESPVGIIFLLTGTIFNMPDAVARARQAGKLTFVHLDLIQGLSRDDYGVRYLADNVAPDGIITTRNSLVASARGRGLLTVQRTFLLDSQSVASGIHLVNESKPDVLEVLPGIIPGEVQQIVRKIRVPLITGGLIRTRAQCSAAMRAGAAGVSTSCQELWTFTPMAGAVAGGKEVDLFKAHREVH
ncbi:MAG: glycerol-3-phosphate responsive antiterminator [Bacillota bacterium]